MDDDVRSFGEELGRRVLARDWSGVREMLAPWMQRVLSADQVRAFFEDEYRSTLAGNGIDEMHHPDHPDPLLGGNGFMTASALREPIEFEGGRVRPLAPEVTDENVRYWMKLELPCSEEQADALDFDVFCEVWMALVATRDGLRVGYWSQGAY